MVWLSAPGTTRGQQMDGPNIRPCQHADERVACANRGYRTRAPACRCVPACPRPSSPLTQDARSGVPGCYERPATNGSTSPNLNLFACCRLPTARPWRRWKRLTSAPNVLSTGPGEGGDHAARRGLDRRVNGGDIRACSVRGAEEVDGEADRASWLDLMLDIGRDALRIIGLNDHVGWRIGAGDETQRSGFDAQATPGPARHSMERRRASGMVLSSHVAVVRTTTRPSGSSQRSQAGQFSIVPIRRSRSAASPTQGAGRNGGR
jgi:hypothetical protein